MKKIVSLILAVLMLTTLISCKAEKEDDNSLTVGICNYVDDASLNQIVDNIKAKCCN